MKIFEINDPDKPIEEYPGILGYFLDGNLSIIHEALQPLKECNFQEYIELLEEKSEIDNHRLMVNLSSGDKELEIEWGVYEINLLSQIPSITVCQDAEPENSGPGYSSGFPIFMSEHFSIEQISHDLSALAGAIKADYARLQSV